MVLSILFIVQRFRRKLETFLERYGVEYPSQCPEIKKKIRETFLERYGVEYPAQCPEIFHKILMSGYRRKEYIFPSGRLEYCQGYEPKCFDYLLRTYDEDDIEVGYLKERSAIWYKNPDREGKLSRYYPDGFIKSENAVVEVKSEYTYNKEFLKNRAKFRRVVEMGYRLFLYVLDKKGLIYTKIYDKDEITVCPHPPAQLIFI